MNSGFSRRSCRVLALLACALLAPAAHAQSVTVFAAASLKEALDELVRQHAAKDGKRASVSYAASSALARQIERGAPADLFISADTEWMDYLAERKLLVDRTRVSLLTNRLVLVAPAGGNTVLKIGPGFPLASAIGTGRLAMADPDSVPAGKYGRAALESLGVWRAVASRAARADNVRSALALVARGEAVLGVVYRTDAIAEPKVRIAGEFPADSHPPIVYPAAVVVGGRPEQAEGLLRFLASEAARPVWFRHGFGAGG